MRETEKNPSLSIQHHVIIDGITGKNEGITNNLSKIPESPSLSIEVSDVNRGKAAQLNKYLRRLDSRWLMFLDSDDIFLPGKISSQIKILTRNPRQVVGTGYYSYNDRHEFLAKICPPNDRNMIATRFVFGPELLFSSLCMSTEELSGFNEVFDESLRAGIDYDFYSRLISRLPFTNVQQPLTGYKLNGPGITRTSTTRRMQIQVHLDVVRRMMCKGSLLAQFNNQDLALCIFRKASIGSIVEELGALGQSQLAARALDLKELISKERPTSVLQMKQMKHATVNHLSIYNTVYSVLSEWVEL